MAELFIISAASGTGKTSLVKNLLTSVTNLVVSISHTTRSPRPAEIDGVHYHFINREQFNQLLTQQSFIEYAEVFNNFYGTSWQELNKHFAVGNDVILEIDWQGARQARVAFPEAVTIFILPPSRDTLKQRLEKRDQNSSEVIDNRLAGAREEISHWDEFDYTLINDDFDHTLNDLQAIIRARRLLRVNGQAQINSLIKDLLT